MDAQPTTNLFDTSTLAGQAATRSNAGRRAKILSFLAERGDGTLFEIADHYGLFDHQISGRFTELAREGLIVRTGQRRTKPETGCVADVWKLADAQELPRGGRPKDAADKQGYPDELIIPGEGHFVRGPVLGSDDAPGIPYALHRDAAGLRLSYRVELIECPACGRPLRMAVERIDGKDAKVYRCGTPACGGRTWHLTLAKEPGRAELLALVLKRL